MTIDTTSTRRNLDRFEASLNGESSEGVTQPLHDEFGPQALHVLRFVQAAVAITTREQNQDRWLKRAFLVGFGLSTGLDLVVFTLWKVLS